MNATINVSGAQLIAVVNTAFVIGMVVSGAVGMLLLGIAHRAAAGQPPAA